VLLGDHSTNNQAYIDMSEKISNAFESGVTRVYKYNTSEYTLPQASYLSLDFNSLDSIKAFENFVKTEYNVQIEMSQINAKENFNAVSIMANILSWAMIVFSIVCIIMFIINMLQSYFQKVKRNLGTFKAFGIDSNELILVYVMILLLIILIAISLSILMVWSIELVLPLLDIMKDNTHSYLALWSSKTVLSIIIVLVATISTVFIVMSRLLKQTPGDLIYDRN
jgi:predicted lysophospholipase L1 biosynthesis ABC-type transport system permease subunit